MSIIVVVKKGGRCVMAADTAQSDDSLMIRAPYVTNHEKIIRFGDNLLGLAGWSVAQDIMESVIRHHPGRLNFDSRAEIFETARNVHSLMKSDYYIDPQEEKDQPVESSQIQMLIANPFGIYELESYRSVAEYERFWALGSGRFVALGALYACYDRLADPEEIARIAVEAACEFDDGCALPMTVHTVGGEADTAYG